MGDIKISKKDFDEINKKAIPYKRMSQYIASLERSSPTSDIFVFGHRCKKKYKDAKFSRTGLTVSSYFKELEKLGLGILEKGKFHWTTGNAKVIKKLMDETTLSTEVFAETPISEYRNKKRQKTSQQSRNDLDVMSTSSLAKLILKGSKKIEHLFPYITTTDENHDILIGIIGPECFSSKEAALKFFNHLDTLVEDYKKDQLSKFKP